MPASISLILYIVEESVETIGTYTIQKGMALSHVCNTEPQKVQFMYFIPEDSTETDENDDDDRHDTAGEALQVGQVYLTHGKFTYLYNNNSIDLIILSHVLLPINASECPESLMVAKYIGKVTSSAISINAGLKLVVTVSEYIRKNEKPINEITITHPATGRLSRSINAAQKNAVVQFTGILIIHEGVIYCDLLDFSFVGSKYDDINYSNPWAAAKSESAPKSAVSRRIEAIHKEHNVAPQTQTKPQSPTKRQTRSKTKVVDSSPANIASSVIKEQTPIDDDVGQNDESRKKQKPK